MRRHSAKRRKRHGDPDSPKNRVRSLPRWWRLTIKHMTTPILTSADLGFVSSSNQHRPVKHNSPYFTIMVLN